MSQEKKYGPHIVQSPPEYSMCTGCTSCEMVCSLTHDGCTSPSYRRIFFEHGDVMELLHTVHSCQYCADHPCYNACPKKDTAMKIDENGIVYIDEEGCIGCGMCVRACVFDPPRIGMVNTKDKKQRKAKKCDLCRGRAEGPACVQYCPVKALHLSTEELPWEKQ